MGSWVTRLSLSSIRRNCCQGPGSFVTRILNLTFTLIVLFGVAFLSLSAFQAGSPREELTILMGFILLASSVAGSLAARVGLPKITGFLVVGLLAGPSVLGLIPRGALDALHLIDRFALALIALLAGGELKLKALRPAARTILLTTLALSLIHISEPTRPY